MGVLSLLFSFHGRISRLQYWLCSMLNGFFGVALFVFLIMSTGASLGNAKVAPQALAAFGSAVLMGIPVLLVTAWIAIALQVKRFHDRGRTGWIVLAPLVVSMFAGSAVIGHIASGVSPGELIAAMQPYSLVMNLISLAFFIDLNCLGSVEGPNKYGDPPTSGGRPLSSPSAPNKPAASGGASPEPAMSALFGAQSAMDRAIAIQSRVVGSQPRAVAATAAAPRASADLKPATGGFGRRPAR